MICPCAAKILLSSSGVGRGASGGGNVAAPARIDPSRTSRLEPRGRAENQHARRVAVDAESVRDAHRDDGGSADFEGEAPLTGLHGESAVEDDVALILWVGVPGRRSEPRKEELDQRKSSVNHFAGHADRCKRPEEPTLLAVDASPERERSVLAARH